MTTRPRKSERGFVFYGMGSGGGRGDQTI